MINMALIEICYAIYARRKRSYPAHLCLISIQKYDYRAFVLDEVLHSQTIFLFSSVRILA